MKKIMFIYNEDDDTFEFHVDGECITDCFSTRGECGSLIKQLNTFADVPIYKRIDGTQIGELKKKVEEQIKLNHFPAKVDDFQCAYNIDHF